MIIDPRLSSSKQVLILGRTPELFHGLVQELTKLGVRVQGSTDAKNAAEKFNANDFELNVFGSALVGRSVKWLRREFERQNCGVQSLSIILSDTVRVRSGSIAVSAGL